MSTKSLSNYKMPPHRRDGSDELDVFEAARYFSDYNDNNALVDTYDQKVIKQAKQGYFRQGRASLDLPTLKHHQQQHYYKQYHQNYPITTQLEQQRQDTDSHMRPSDHSQKQQMKDNKKYKQQPSSPSGKLAQFLNSIFNQKFITNSSKNKKQPKSTQSMKDEDENPSGRRQRRSSISHLRSSSSAVADSKSLIYSSSSSGFATPPPYTAAEKTCQNNAKTLDDYKQVLSNLSKHKIVHGEKTEHPKNDRTRAANYGGKNKPEKIKKREIMKMDDEEEQVVVDDDDCCGESDASSDLFELQIDYELGFSASSTELPVYETTHLGAITNAPIKI